MLREDLEPLAHLFHRSIIKLSPFLLVRRGEEILGKINLEPWVLTNPIDGDAVERIDAEHGCHEIGGIPRDVVRDCEDAPSNLLEQVRHVVVVKRKLAAQEYVENHTTRPDVHLGSGVQHPGNDLGSSVVGATTRRFEEVPVGHYVGQPKVCNLDVVLRIQQQILRFEIPVHHHVAVAVVNSRDDLLEKLPGVLFLELAVLQDIVKKLATRDILHHEENVRR
mmetsp:Transcript_27383/g.71829  ORF Transcript_27383/g.71829 Transcript_27383/m.71829 type:complete len:222 (+) Transcript_27383:771-1436(+)